MPEELCASVNRIPSRARRSRFGVGIFESGFWIPRSPYPMSSAYRMTMLGGASAADAEPHRIPNSTRKLGTSLTACSREGRSIRFQIIVLHFGSPGGEPGAKPGDDGGELRLAGEIGVLAGVIDHIEQLDSLRCILRVLDEGPAVVTQQEPPAGRRDAERG